MPETAAAAQPEPARPSGERPAAEAPPSRRIAGLSPWQLAGLAAAVLVAQAPFVHYLLRGEPAVSAAVPFEDSFAREAIGPNYFTTGGHWRIVNGAVLSPGVKNNPLWLRAKLPPDVAVEFDVRSESSDGDIKCEIFGNGRDHASGYVVVFGGWSNSMSVIARLDEHGRDRKENRALKVEKGRTYHFRIERKGGLLRWLADGELMMEYDDRVPLRGDGHDRFGFSTWEADVYFDNLKIAPL